MDIKNILWIGFPPSAVEKVFNQVSDYSHKKAETLDDRSIYRTLKHDLCLIFIALAHPDEQELDAITNIRQRFPLHPTVIFIQELSTEFMTWALRNRIFNVISSTDFLSDLEHHFQSTLKKMKQDGFFSYVLPYEIDGDSSAIITKKVPAKTEIICRYIDRNFQKKITLDIAAQICGLSTSQFSRTFKKENRICFQDYLILRRIEQAQIILRSTNNNITEVALSVGFHDHSYFTRVFHRIVGMTPTQFVQKNGASTGKNPTHTIQTTTEEKPTGGKRRNAV